jgi:GntR family transcriptional regulator/MocR family aminotransferase
MQRRSELHPAMPLAISQISIAPDSPLPIYEQICRALRKAISVGDLPVGTLLPTSRELSQALGVGRNTVVSAYSRLVAEGFVVSKFRRGTRVAAPLQPSNQPPSPEMRGESSSGEGEAEPLVDIGYSGQRTLQGPDHTEYAPLFSIHAPDAVLHSRTVLQKLIADAFSRTHAGGLDGQGDWRRFQSAVASHFRQARGVRCEPGQVIPVTGVCAALDLTARLMLDPGHAVLIEDPAPDEVRAAFSSAGARLYALPSDSNGADILRAKSPPPRLIYVSPSLSFPSGAQMPTSRRTALLEAARASGSAIFEFDGYAELLYTGSRLGAMKGQDKEGRILYYASLKNTLGPHLRVGVLIVPAHLVDAFSRMIRLAGSAPEGFLLGSVAEFIETSQYAMHVKKLRAAYAQRLKLIVETCQVLLPDAIVNEPNGGLHLTVNLPGQVSAHRVWEVAAEQGLAVAPLARFSQRKQPENALVIGFGALPDRLLEPSIRRLAAIVRELAPPPSQALRACDTSPVNGGGK